MTNTSQLQFARAFGNTGAQTVPTSPVPIGTFQYFTYTAASTYSKSAEIRVEMNTTPSSTNADGKIIFATTATGALTTTDRIAITAAGNLNIYNNAVFGNSTATPLAPIDAYGGAAFSFIGGSDGSNTRTNATTKTMRFGTVPYTNAQNPVTAFNFNNNATTNILGIGGGTGLGQAITVLNFYVSATQNNGTGTLIGNLTSTGWRLGDNIAATAMLDVLGDGYISGNAIVGRRLAIGGATTNPSCMLFLSGTFATLNVFSSNGFGLSIPAQNWSCLATTPGTQAQGAIHSLGIPTLISTNAAIVTDAYNLYIDGPATQGANVTITNPWSLYVKLGNTFLGGGLFQGTANAYSTGGYASLVRNATSGRLETIASTAGNAFRLTASGNGSSTTITIAHGQTGITSTSKVIITANSSAAGGYTYVTVDATNISIVYATAPITGTNNLTYSVYLTI